MAARRRIVFEQQQRLWQENVTEKDMIEAAAYITLQDYREGLAALVNGSVSAH